MKLLTKLLAGVLVIGLLVYVLRFVYPFALPLVLHHQWGWLHMFINEVIATNPPRYYPFVILGFMCVMYLLVALDLKLRRSTTHGSSRYATFQEARRFASPLLLFRAPFFVLNLAWSLLRLLFASTRSTAQMLGPVRTVSSGQRKAYSHPLISATRFVIGRYLLQTISLTEQQQWEHVLLTAPTGRGKSSLIFIPTSYANEGAAHS